MHALLSFYILCSHILSDFNNNEDFFQLLFSMWMLSSSYIFCKSVHLHLNISKFLQMPDAVVDYELSSGNWNIVQQQNLLYERTRILYGTTSSGGIANGSSNNLNSDFLNEIKSEDDNLWNCLSEFYACEQYDVSSYDGVMVPLTILYSRKNKNNNQNPGLLHGHGAYGELLDKRWRNDLKSLLDRGWVIAYADVRYVFHLYRN